MADSSSSATTLTYVYPSFQLRHVMRGAEPWFIAADVCAALGVGNTGMAIGRLDDDEKGVISIDTPGGPQRVGIVSESGLYALILGSRKQQAKVFRKWVTSEVLPAIRRTGRYETTSPAPEPALLAGMQAQVGALQEQITARDTAIAKLHGQLLGSMGRQVRLLERMAHVQRRAGRREAVRLAVDMERRGEPRERIRLATGINDNYLRQIMFKARAAGDLPPLPAGAEGGEASAPHALHPAQHQLDLAGMAAAAVVL
jgi:prophage antirepressor-like protein